MRFNPTLTQRSPPGALRSVHSATFVQLAEYSLRNTILYSTPSILPLLGDMILEEIKRYFQVETLYQVLEVSNNCSPEDLKKAYFRRSLEVHPDKITDSSLKESSKIKFQLLTEAYKILGSPQSRERYDNELVSSSTEHTLDSNSTAYDVIPLKLCDEHETSYSYDCRCSGRFILNKSLITATTTFIINCDSCSNNLKITS